MTAVFPAFISESSVAAWNGLRWIQANPFDQIDEARLAPKGLRTGIESDGGKDGIPIDVSALQPTKCFVILTKRGVNESDRGGRNVMLFASREKTGNYLFRLPSPSCARISNT